MEYDKSLRLLSAYAKSPVEAEDIDCFEEPLGTSTKPEFINLNLNGRSFEYPDGYHVMLTLDFEGKKYRSEYIGSNSRKFISRKAAMLLVDLVSGITDPDIDSATQVAVSRKQKTFLDD